MLSKTGSRYAILIFGIVFVLPFFIGLSGSSAADECNIYGCEDDCLFTQEFRLQNCWGFKHVGKNPYFILKPGYRLVLETPVGTNPEEMEKSVETVLWRTKWIRIDHRWIKTRVVEERAFEWDEEDGEWVTVEISLNYFAICRRTNAVYYFGEWSRECEDGFNEDDECEGEESTEGSWEAGVDGALPGLIMPGTPLLGSRFFQEIAEEQEAVDRGEVMDLGLEVAVPAGTWSGCIEIHDTNPSEAEEGGCIGENDVKLYCPRVGLVQDQDLELLCYGFHCDDDDGDDDDDDDDDDDRRHRTWIHPDRFRLWNF